MIYNTPHNLTRLLKSTKQRKLNYDLTLCRVLDVDKYEQFDGVVFTNDGVKYADAIILCDKVDEIGIELHSNLKAFVCSWYNGVDNPLDTMTLDEFNKI